MKLSRALLAVVAGTVVTIVWGMLFWGLLAPALGMFHRLPQPDAVTQVLIESGTSTGTYFMPWPRDTPAAFDAFTEQHTRGPFFQLSFVREGVDPNSPAKLALGTLHYALVAFLVALLLRLVHAPTLGRRVAVVVVAGLLGSVFITLGVPVWFHLPWDHVRGSLIYELVSWTLLGLVVGAIDRTRVSAASSA